jgi:hypothetical protein
MTLTVPDSVVQIVRKCVPAIFTAVTVELAALEATAARDSPPSYGKFGFGAPPAA